MEDLRYSSYSIISESEVKVPEYKVEKHEETPYEAPKYKEKPMEPTKMPENYEAPLKEITPGYKEEYKPKGWSNSVC